MRDAFRISSLLLALWACSAPIRSFAQEAAIPDASSPDSAPSLEDQRMDLMRSRAMAMKFLVQGPKAQEMSLPQSVNAEPLFRYDDIPRGYVDGAVWRWGKTGRPLAIITTELHPRYLGGGSRIVYDFLSLADFPFSALSSDSSWQPSDSAVQMKLLENAPRPAATEKLRVIQMNRIMQKFVASQVVSEETPDTKRLNLRLLPRAIDNYKNEESETHGATFLFVAGRMPGVIVFLETDGQTWLCGIGRLSAPSTLVVTYNGDEVYRVPPNFGTWSANYNASNSSIVIPGVAAQP